MKGRLAHIFTIDQDELDKMADRVVRDVLGAGTAAIAHRTRTTEKELEALTRGAVKGRLWRAWKSEVHPKNGIAREPTGSIFVNGKERSVGAMQYFTRPGRLAGRKGQYLAVPTAAAGSRGKSRDLTPEKWEARTGQKLRLVPRGSKPWWLVIDGIYSGKKRIAKGNTKRRMNAGRKSETIVIFTLLPMRAFANKFSIEPVFRRAERSLPDDFASRVRALS